MSDQVGDRAQQCEGTGWMESGGSGMGLWEPNARSREWESFPGRSLTCYSDWSDLHLSSRSPKFFNLYEYKIQKSDLKRMRLY